MTILMELPMISYSGKYSSVIVEIFIYLALMSGMNIGVTCYLSSLDSMWGFQCMLAKFYTHPIFIYSIIVSILVFIGRYRQAARIEPNFKVFLVVSSIGILLLLMVIVFGSIIIQRQTMNDWMAFFSGGGIMVGALAFFMSGVLITISIGFLFLSHGLRNSLLKSKS